MTLTEAIERYISNAEYERTHGNLQGCLEFRQFAEWLTELKKLREQTRWIPVSERLPEEGAEVLVSDYDTYNKKVIISRYQGKRYGFTCGLVSAWMPKPKPYKPQESDHKCHTCKHYTSGENDGSCGNYICKGYSNWESEDNECEKKNFQ